MIFVPLDVLALPLSSLRLIQPPWGGDSAAAEEQDDLIEEQQVTPQFVPLTLQIPFTPHIQANTPHSIGVCIAGAIVSWKNYRYNMT